MDNSNLIHPGDQDPDKPIPLGEELDKPIKNLGEAAVKNVSHSPLDLGSSRPVGVQKVQKQAQPKPVTQVAHPTTQPVSMGRITGIRTFFTKLHVGALSFLDDQIMDWLKNNPDIVIKQTNICVGEVQGKKTEPNIVITVWY
jgi:hypothetical protein